MLDALTIALAFWLALLGLSVCIIAFGLRRDG